VSTTILADDGETVVIGGLINKQNTRQENKIPWFGDIPYVGALFRYRTQTQQKTELIVVLTPRIIRCAADADRFSLQRINETNLDFKDVEKVYGKNWMLTPVQGPPSPHDHGRSVAPPPPMSPAPLPAPIPVLPPGGGVVTPQDHLAAPGIIPPVDPIKP
jgi:hypothetical protein